VIYPNREKKIYFLSAGYLNCRKKVIKRRKNFALFFLFEVIPKIKTICYAVTRQQRIADFLF